MDRYDKYLKKNIPLYLANKFITEIIITDENGNDVKKIAENFNNDKLKLYVNNHRLGPFLNKLHACSRATSEWIALVDSDNFAGPGYFKGAAECIATLSKPKTTILSPSYATEVFQWPHLLMDEPLNKLSYAKYKECDELHDTGKNGKIGHLVNIGNYVINKYMIENLDISKDIDLIKISYSFDVVLMNAMLFEQFDMDFRLVKDMVYVHEPSTDSIYIKWHQRCAKEAQETYNRLDRYFKKD